MEKFIISPIANIGKIGNGNEFVIGYGSRQEIVGEEFFNSLYGLMKFVDGGRTNDEIRKFLLRNNYDESIFEYCLHKKLILFENDYLNNFKNSYLYKNYLYLETYFDNAPEILRNISNTSFVFVGCGGIGTHLGYAISSFNPNKIMLIDKDCIEITNINRQFLFTESDLGLNKVDVIKKELKNRFGKNLNIKTITEYVEGIQLEKEIQKFVENDNCILIVSGDSSHAVEDATRISSKLNIPSLNVGYLDDISAIGPFYIPGKSSCPFCGDIGSKYDADFENHVGFINEKYQSPASFSNCSISASMALIDILKYLGGNIDEINSLNKSIGISNFELKYLEIPMSRNLGCEICGNK